MSDHILSNMAPGTNVSGNEINLVSCFDAIVNFSNTEFRCLSSPDIFVALFALYYCFPGIFIIS